MSEQVAVILRRKESLLLPPEGFSLPYEQRAERETFETTAYRLAASYGVKEVKIDTPLSYSITPESPARAYLLTDSSGVLDRSEFLIPHQQVMEYIARHTGLRMADVALYATALRSL